MIAALLHGFLASIAVSMALAMAAASGTHWPSGWASGILVILIAGTALLQFLQHRRSEVHGPDLERYDGVADLLIHLHTPATPDRPSRWTLRGLLTWALSGLGLPFGPEGIAMELSQAAGMNSRSTSTRWSDLRRRTDAALALAAGMSAGFGAPFAAVLLPAELSIGGRVLASVLASVSAYVGVQYLTTFFGQFGIPVLGFQERLSSLWGFRMADSQDWLSAVLVTVSVSILAAVLLPGLRRTRELMDRLGGGRAWAATCGSGLLLLSVWFLAPQSLGSLPRFFESVVRNELATPALVSLAASLFLVLAAVYSGLGSLGTWWPSFLLGAVSSLLVVKVLLHWGWVHSGVAANSVLLGAVAWSVVWFRTPITLAVLAYELSGKGSLLLPALLAGWAAKTLTESWSGPGWISGILQAKGFPIREGRSVEVLKSLTAGDAMVRDFQSVREHDSIEQCHATIEQCRYPFLAVVNESGAFVGLLTVDLVEQGIQFQQLSRLGGLLEARDLLFRPEARGNLRTARVGMPLSDLGDVFESQICVPVLSEQGHPLGLLFPSDVRHAYDRELARVSFMVQARAR